jgi:hypothetical protein
MTTLQVFNYWLQHEASQMTSVSEKEGGLGYLDKGNIPEQYVVLCYQFIHFLRHRKPRAGRESVYKNLEQKKWQGPLQWRWNWGLKTIRHITNEITITTNAELLNELSESDCYYVVIGDEQRTVGSGFTLSSQRWSRLWLIFPERFSNRVVVEMDIGIKPAFLTEPAEPISGHISVYPYLESRDIHENWTVGGRFQVSEPIPSTFLYYDRLMETWPREWMSLNWATIPGVLL